MGTIWVKELTGGLDARRLPETTPGGVLIRAVDGHITRGGEFEKRAAFVPSYALPSGTVGLAADKRGLVTFGSAAAPVMPVGVRYQRLQHPTGATLIDVPSYDLYDGKIYAVGQFDDGSVHHFYDGVRVEDWFDGRARAAFRVVAGSVASVDAPAQGSFTVTGGTSGSGNEIADIQVAGVSIITNPVAHTGDNSTTAAAIATEINTTTSSPNYTASVVGATVTITAVLTGPAANGRVVSVTVGGDVTVGSINNMAGGTSAAASVLNDIRVNGVSIISAPVEWATSNEATAAAIAAEINGTTSSPNYTASAAGETVNVIAADSGPAPNGYAVAFTTANDLTVSPQTDLVLSGGDTDGGTPATASFLMTDAPPTATILVKVNGVALMAAPVVRGASRTAAAAAVAAAINAHTSAPDYTAAAEGAKVYITTVDNTSAVNGVVPTFEFSGLTPSGGSPAVASFAITGVLPLGGRDGEPFVYPTITPTVNTVWLTAGPVSTDVAPSSVPYLDSVAAALAAAINAHASTPNYAASASGNTVTVTTVANTAAINGKRVNFITSGYITTGANVAFSGGADPSVSGSMVSDVQAFAGGGEADAFVPGLFVRTVGSKVYATAGSLLHFSGIQAPTRWTTDAVGAGFINLAAANSGSEELTAVARYQNLLAVFSTEAVQIWFVDPDPNLNTQSQLLSNTGTSSPRSVTQFGDADVFYLDDSGLRSLRARDSSNAASTTDVGVPIDAVLTAKLATLTPDERRRIVGLINPMDKRFWLIVKDEIFVFTFYQNAKVSAWTTYSTTWRDGGNLSAFVAEHAVVYAKRPYIRADDTVFAYGGLGADPVYDDTQAEAWLPYLDANRPTAKKQWEGIDVALTGDWEVRAAMQPTNLAASEVIARLYHTTYNAQRVAFNHASSHISLRFRSTGTGPAVLSAAVIHFQGDEDEE